MSTATPPLPTTMRGVVMHAPGDVRVEDREVPRVVEPTDAVLKIEVACICGSDLWPYRGIQPVDEARPMGHEYVGTVVEVGDDVKNIEVGDFVVGSFCISDNTCEICEDGFQSRCANGGFIGDTQAEYTRVALADGTLVVVPGGKPEDPEVIASLLAASDVLGTGWFGAVAAQAGPGKTIAVVGDGAVGLSAVLAAKGRGRQMPPPVLVASVDAIDLLCVDIPEAARALARAFWPGGLTLILRARPDLGWDLGETGGTIGVRMPNQAALLRLLHDFGPMAVTSANLTGQPPATSVEQAVGYFGTRVSAYLDGGPTQGSTASSIVDFAHETPRALRFGTISLDDLSAAAGVPIAPVEGAAS